MSFDVKENNPVKQATFNCSGKKNADLKESAHKKYNRNQILSSVNDVSNKSSADETSKKIQICSQTSLEYKGNGYLCGDQNGMIIANDVDGIGKLFKLNSLTLVSTAAMSVNGLCHKGDVFQKRHLPLLADWIRKHYLLHRWPSNMSDQWLSRIIERIESKNIFNPVDEELKNIQSRAKWDGINRCEKYFIEYMPMIESVSESVRKEIGKLFFRCWAGRMLYPGVKMDLVFVLQGAQGKRKSSSLGALAGALFTDQVNRDFDKNAVHSILGYGLIELAEATQLSKKEVEQVKHFITTQVDRVRLPYERRVMEFPRQSLMVITTNKYQISNDETGNRRYIPIPLQNKDIDCEAIARDREQLILEAVNLAKKDKSYYPKGEELVAYLTEAQDSLYETLMLRSKS
ncbi:putative P-loop ATPase [Piscirickettsia salmonis]|uniref:VapE domain-containing protein n=1 Tax=Piscirickettsia salmonis TaxID=1238 RepID=UPI0012BAE464|nr:VapE domain-containing protein [Piscirickettsia salmonis]QGP53366.1 putative P-loop ATPase [Piscirickettsia salmonis]QGP60715.1 putative P-loop ATPase [Piscirickettsia salmonis]QGP62931.1 putative P-loop ATPase [Piscirickettsia salmonis]